MRLQPTPNSSRRNAADAVEQCEAEKACCVGSGEIFEDAEKGRQKEAAQSASGADDAGDEFDVRGEALRRDLKNSAVSHSQHAHDDEKQGHDNGDGRQRTDGGETERDPAEERGQGTEAAEAVGEQTADGSQEATGEDDDGAEVAGVDFAQLVLIAEKEGGMAAGRGHFPNVA